MQLISAYSTVQDLLLPFPYVENPCCALLHDWDRQWPVVGTYRKNNFVCRFFLKGVQLVIGPEEFLTSGPVCHVIAGRDQFPAPGTQNREHFFYVIRPDCGDQRLHRLLRRGKGLLLYAYGFRVRRSPGQEHGSSDEANQHNQPTLLSLFIQCDAIHYFLPYAYIIPAKNLGQPSVSLPAGASVFPDARGSSSLSHVASWTPHLTTWAPYFSARTFYFHVSAV